MATHFSVGQTVSLAHPTRLEGELRPGGTQGKVVSLHRLHARVALAGSTPVARVVRIELVDLIATPTERSEQ